jgi:hypothetical protein
MFRCFCLNFLTFQNAFKIKKLDAFDPMNQNTMSTHVHQLLSGRPDRRTNTAVAQIQSKKIKKDARNASRDNFMLISSRFKH